ncbi:hypothetical protein EP073_09790 [Geovibrio thiophilus]|uniref:Lipoprotein n=1 Tax=Geovibrio thiophilus TaxID=139438 RepID=A0A410JZY3_9BACT|nr:hypothetical protein [Geovibrio thiophilus]QAR33683.1 hypothetical protein EP073_09790 [Geovibrio thiophilus]
MLKSKVLIFFIFVTFILVGCGYREATVQSRDIGYLKFYKSAFATYKITVNERYTFELEHCTIKRNEAELAENECIDSNSNTVYEVQSGKVELKVYTKDNLLIMSKEIYLGSNSTYEVKLP